MARSEAKKRLVENEKRLALLKKITLGVNAVYFLYRVMFHWSSFGFFSFCGLGLLSVVYYFVHKGIQSYATPTFDEDGKPIDVPDIANPQGLAEYYFDILYIQYFVQVTTMFSNWFWLVYLVIPAFAGYKLIKMAWPYLAMYLKGGMGGDQYAQGMSEKKMAKLKRKEERREKLAVKYRVK